MAPHPDRSAGPATAPAADASPRGWVMAQVWRDLLFAHWPVPPAALERFVPPGTVLDTFDGEAWVGVVPFRMSGVRLRGTPPLPWVSAFPELNVRTYVRLPDGSGAGVVFQSLDAGNPLAVAVARGWYGLPYFRARMRCAAVGDRIEYASRRTHRGAPPAELVGRYGPTGPPAASAPGTLEHFLTERYRLYVAGRDGRTRAARVHHAPWPLQPAAAELERDTMAAAHGIALPDRPPLLHFAARLEVRAAAPRPLA